MVLRGLVIIIALLVTARPADACAIKNNQVTIVLGVVGNELVSLRLDLHQDDDGLQSEWTGTATLVAGTKTTVIGALDPKVKPSVELDRLVAAARQQAQALTGFTAAVQVSAKDCSEKAGSKCDGVVLENANATLRIGALKTPLAITIEPESRKVIGVVRYKAGRVAIAVANIGLGDPRWSVPLRACEGSRCREITTLHHGEQVDVAVITSP